jgi:TRAP-type C4-dicarboxylate transport system permease small subunit
MQAENHTRPARFLARWHQVECLVAVAAFGLIALLLMIDVLGREFVGPVFKWLDISGATGLPGAQKLSVFALVVGAYAGLGIATATNSHLVPRVAFSWIPAAWSDTMNRVADVVTGIVLVGIAYYGFVFVLASKGMSMRAPVLNWEVWPFQLAIPLGFVSAAVRNFAYAIWPDCKAPPPEFQE